MLKPLPFLGVRHNSFEGSKAECFLIKLTLHYGIRKRGGQGVVALFKFVVSSTNRGDITRKPPSHFSPPLTEFKTNPLGLYIERKVHVAYGSVENFVR